MVQSHAGGDSTTTSSSSSSNFGGWEAHTRGIGSRLMLKMGYEYGKGKGRDPRAARAARVDEDGI